MADIEKGIPVRTEDDADQKIQSKIVDMTTPTQGVEVDTDGNAHVEMHGNDPSGTDVVARLSELGALNGDGDYDASNNTKPSSAGVIAHDQAASPDETGQNVRVTGVQGTVDNTIHAMHVAMTDHKGDAFSTSNPLPVAPDALGEPDADYDTASAVAAAATSDHDLVVNDGETLHLYHVRGSASSRAKWELKIGDGAVSEAFTTKEVQFTTESNQNAKMDFTGAPLKVVGTANGTTVRLTRTNRDDDDAMDVYSTFVYNLES